MLRDKSTLDCSENGHSRCLAVSSHRGRPRLGIWPLGLGAWLGPGGLIATFIWIGLLGALLALASAWRGQRDFAMGPAIAAGLAVHLIWPAALLKMVVG